jgi:hypothetical protein
MMESKNPLSAADISEHHFENHDEQIKAIFEAIRQLVTTPERNVKKIGFTIKEKQKAYRRKSRKK